MDSGILLFHVELKEEDLECVEVEESQVLG